MADSTPFKNPHTAVTPNQNPSKPSNYLCKPFFIILILLVIPFIPTQAPEFISPSIFTKLWELFHLLFIGLAVCYGLFSKRSSSDNVDLENHSTNDDSHVGFSGILNISSFFEDGSGNSCGYDEKRLILQSNKNNKSLLYENGAVKICDFDEKKVIESWNSKYVRVEPMVVVANDEWGKPMSKIEHKPLNLPVRSLRSRVKDGNNLEENKIIGSSLSVESSYESDVEVEVRKFRGMVPINLEKKFEKVSGPAPIPWRSRSGRFETREEISKPPSLTRPHSVREFRHPKISSVTSSETSSVSELSSSNVVMENLGSKKDVMNLSNAVPHPRMSGEVSKSRIFRIGSSNEMRMEGSDKENLLQFGKSIAQQCLGSENPRWSFFDSDDKLSHPEKVLSRGKSLGSENPSWSFFYSDGKSSHPAKGLSRGKSVRTIRSNKHVLDEVKAEVNNSNSLDDNTGKMRDVIEAASFMKEVKEEKTENPRGNTKNPILDNICSIQKPTFSEEAESAREPEFFQLSSNEEAGSDIEGSEVDRKAGEFIAKFREQIKLQKLASIKRSRG